MLVSVNDAAVMANLSRQTLYRMVKNGDISTSQDRKGRKQIETSELVRVFGTIRELPPREARNLPRQPQVVSDVSHEIHSLQMENAVLKQRLEHYEMMLKDSKQREEKTVEHYETMLKDSKQREEKASNQSDRHLQTIERLTLRLEYTPPPAATQAPRKAPSKMVPKKAEAKAKPQPNPSKATAKTVKAPAVKVVPKKTPAKPAVKARSVPVVKVTAKKSAVKPKSKR